MVCCSKNKEQIETEMDEEVSRQLTMRYAARMCQARIVKRGASDNVLRIEERVDKGVEKRHT